MLQEQSRKRWRAELSNSNKARRARKTSFRLNPTFVNKGTNQLSLLGRRKATNGAAIEASATVTLFPTSANTVDLLTPALVDLTTPPKATSVPHSAADSAYYSAPNTVSKSVSPARHMPPGTIDPVVLKNAQDSPAPDYSIADYNSKMHDNTDSQFFKKFIKKKFTHPMSAKNDLKPIMRQVLQKPEDRPMVPKAYLIIDFRAGTIRGEARMVRKPVRKPGQRRCDGPHEEMTWYFGEKIGYN
ncbi:unnamed protein product [Tuber melanosporum]|uniref:(Perigord truffle) hypothetical protein n=1 Tax=Tuber melanosporum (strain Mel28) TaxID=656061 RepID=D5G7R1_TUBMM|nr:uncharacterized protein GSTUM_00004686001 [Tuber melanosporum]CAZ80554.1 unnamed protein product [Tuber melanosporum]